jgi:hypothetical protein
MDLILAVSPLLLDNDDEWIVLLTHRKSLELESAVAMFFTLIDKARPQRKSPRLHATLKLRARELHPPTKANREGHSSTSIKIEVFASPWSMESKGVTQQRRGA